MEVAHSSKLSDSDNLTVRFHHDVVVHLALVVRDPLLLREEGNLGLGQHAHLALQDNEVIEPKDLDEEVMQAVAHYQGPKDDDRVLRGCETRKERICQLNVGAVVIVV